MKPSEAGMGSSAIVAHQFDTIEQQRESATLGMWVFLVTEVMFFGGLFAAYTVYRYLYPEILTEMSHHMNLLLGTINTGVLLTSSFTVVMAVHYAREGNRKGLLLMLLITVACAFGFLGIKAVEYTEKYHHGTMIGSAFHMAGPDAGKFHLWYCLYFFMTGLHGIHVVIGIGLFMWIFCKAYRGSVIGEGYLPVEIVGLYWHFVDLVWVFLFPLFYLVGTR